MTENSITRFGISPIGYGCVEFSDNEKEDQAERLKNIEEVDEEWNIKRIMIPGGLRDFIDSKYQSESYDPLFNTPELYTELYKLKLFDLNALLKFVQTYGLPCDNQEIPPGKIDLAKVKFGNSNEILFKKMDTLLFYDKLVEFKVCMELWKFIKTNDDAAITKYIVSFKDRAYLLQYVNLIMQYPEEYGEKMSSFSRLTTSQEIEDTVNNALKNKKDISFDPAFQTWREVKEHKPKIIAEAILSYLLNQHEAGISKTEYRKLLDQNNKWSYKIIESMMFNDLFEVAFFQLKSAIINDMNVMLCENCQQPFVPRHKRQRFCPPRRDVKRSTCENTYNKRVRRKK